MTTYCPHCRDQVAPDELLDGDSGECWECVNCNNPNLEEEDECLHCGLSRDASDYLSERG